MANTTTAEASGDGRRLSGLERASILMLALGEGHAADILKHMGRRRCRRSVSR